jgi:hypothetical protein
LLNQKNLNWKNDFYIKKVENLEYFIVNFKKDKIKTIDMQFILKIL